MQSKWVGIIVIKIKNANSLFKRRFRFHRVLGSYKSLYHFTLLVPFEKMLVFRSCCGVQNVASIIIFIPFFFSFFFFLRSYNKWAKKAVVYADRANTMLRSPVAGLKIRTGQRTISGLIADLTIKLPFWRSF